MARNREVWRAAQDIVAVNPSFLVIGTLGGGSAIALTAHSDLDAFAGLVAGLAHFLAWITIEPPPRLVVSAASSLSLSWLS